MKRCYFGILPAMLEALHKNDWLVIVCFAGFLSSFGMGLTNPVLSLYAKGFNVSTSLVGVFITTFALGRVIVTIPAGRAADRWGRQKLLLLGTLIVFFGSFGLSTASNFPELLVFRSIQGVGSAFYMSAILLVIADRATPKERGRSNGAFQSSVLFGLTISPVIGGVIANEFGIRAPFYTHSIFSIFLIFFIWRWFPKGYTRRSYSSDHQTNKCSQPLSHRSLIWSLLSDRKFLLISLVAFMIFVVRAGSRDTIIPLLGTEALGLTTKDLGLLFTLIGLFNLVAIPIAGWVTDHVGRKPTVVTGLVFMGVSLWILLAAPNYLIFMAGALFLGLGKGFSEPSSIVYLTDITPRQHFGGSFGLFLTLRDLGLFVGPVFLGWLADTYSLRLPLIVNAVALFVTAILFVMFAKETLQKISSSVK